MARPSAQLCCCYVNAYLSFNVLDTLQVGAATPIVEGVFAILRGCKGFEEQALVRATAFMSGTYGVSGRTEELRLPREAFMATLLERAFVVDSNGEWGVEGEPADLDGLSTRRLQVRYIDPSQG